MTRSRSISLIGTILLLSAVTIAQAPATVSGRGQGGGDLRGDRLAQQPAAAVDQGQLARNLRDGTREEREAAARAVLRIPPNERAPFVLAAVSDEVRRVKEESKQRYLAFLAGQPVAPPNESESEHLFALLDALAQSDDPIVIPGLLLGIENGNRPIDAVVAFGELAVANVAAIALDSDGSDVDAAIDVLRRMLERPVRHPLSAATRSLIIRVAQQRLAGNQRPAVVLSAIDLAVATGSSSLIQKVQTLADSEPAVSLLGITEVRLIQIVQKRAATALSARQQSLSGTAPAR